MILEGFMEKNWSIVWNDFRKGDKEAFKKIYDGFLKGLFAYGKNLTAQTSIVEDSIQELFVEMYSHRKNLSETENLQYYLLKGLRRIIFHKLKRESRYLFFEDYHPEALNFKFEIETKSPDDIYLKKIETVKKSLAALKPKSREIIYLKFSKGFSYKQIGEMLEMQPDSAKKQVYRVISKLREDLGSRLLEFFLLCYKA